MHVITIDTPSLGDRSYLVHDGSVALVVDPQRDLDRVLDEAEAAGATITHIAETHLHNDYVSGGLALSRRCGARYVHAAAEELPFHHHGVADGDRIRVGELDVEVLYTPGHTEHHLSYLVRRDGAAPVAFTGGSLLLGTVGRTDLVAAEITDDLTRAQYRSAPRLAELLPDDAGSSRPTGSAASVRRPRAPGTPTEPSGSRSRSTSRSPRRGRTTSSRRWSPASRPIPRITSTCPRSTDRVRSRPICRLRPRSIRPSWLGASTAVSGWSTFETDGRSPPIT